MIRRNVSDFASLLKASIYRLSCRSDNLKKNHSQKFCWNSNLDFRNSKCPIQYTMLYLNQSVRNEIVSIPSSLFLSLFPFFFKFQKYFTSLVVVRAVKQAKFKFNDHWQTADLYPNLCFCKCKNVECR